MMLSNRKRGTVMKRLTILILVLAMCLTFAACGCKHEWLAATCENPKTCELCGETEGEAKGHSMVEATCEEPKHCENCNLTEGEPLGHTWVDATTEAPKTCQTCGATEGERIITDPRFTTAATKDLHGKWELEMELTGDMMGIPDFPAGAVMKLILIFSNSGELDITVEVGDSFMDALKQYTIDSVYAEFEAQGMDRESADVAFAEAYSMTIEEYVDEEIGAIDLNEMFASLFGAIELGGVYYVEDGVLYAGDSWEDELDGESFTLNGDSLILESITEEFGTEQAFTRVAE